MRRHQSGRSETGGDRASSSVSDSNSSSSGVNKEAVQGNKVFAVVSLTVLVLVTVLVRILVVVVVATIAIAT